VEHFRRWLGQRPLSHAAVQQFLRRHLPACRCQEPMIRSPYRNHIALRRLLAMIEPPAERRQSEFPRGFTGRLLRRYQEQLISVRGLTAGTVRNRLRSARTILTRLNARRASQLAGWTPERIEEYVAEEARRHQPVTVG
jgi:hypothetical protein